MRAETDSQCSTCDQSLDIISVDLQGFVVLVHGLHVAAMLKVVHPSTYANTEGGEGGIRETGKQTDGQRQIE